MNAYLLNKFPKKLDVSNYIKKLKNDGMKFSCELMEDEVFAYLQISPSDNFSKLRISYSVYDFEGVVAYLPFKEEDIYESSLLDVKYFCCQLNGGFESKDINDTIMDMYNWLLAEYGEKIFNQNGNESI